MIIQWHAAEHFLIAELADLVQLANRLDLLFGYAETSILGIDIDAALICARGAIRIVQDAMSVLQYRNKLEYPFK